MPVCGHAEKPDLKLSDHQRSVMCSFDAKIRPLSTDPDDLIYAYAYSMDACIGAFLAPADMLDAGVLAERHGTWPGTEGRAVVAGQRSLADFADRARGPGFDPQAHSQCQKYRESLANQNVRGQSW